MRNIRKITEHTYSSHIYMKLEIDGKEYEVTCYCGTDYSWNTFKTSADGTPEREQVIQVFRQLY